MSVSAMRTGASILAVLFLVLSPASLAQMDPGGLGRVSITNYVLPGYGPDGAVQWLLSGRRAEIVGNTVALDDDNVADTNPGVRLVYFDAGGRKIIVESQSCEFNRLTKMGISRTPVKVYSPEGGWEVTGVGYEFWPDQRRLRILSRVKMSFQDLRQIIPAKKPKFDEAPGETTKRTDVSEGAKR